MTTRAGQLVREARRRAGLSQAELARRASTTQSDIARLERGRSDPGLQRVVGLVRACGLRLSTELVADEGDPDWPAVERNLALSPVERWDKAVTTARFVLAGRDEMAHRR